MNRPAVVKDHRRAVAAQSGGSGPAGGGKKQILLYKADVDRERALFCFPHQVVDVKRDFLEGGKHGSVAVVNV